MSNKSERDHLWRQQNPDKVLATYRKWSASPKGAASRRRRATAAGKVRSHKNWLKARHGLTPAQFAEMLMAQGGRCAICDGVLLLPHIDHDHMAGAIRGLLCLNCNTGLGLFRDKPELLTKAARYLKKI